MNPTVYLFCEGGAGSPDMMVLKKIPFSGKTVIPQPFGGKGGHSRYMEGFGAYARSLGTTPEGRIIGFRDRDFDFKVPQSPKLTSAGLSVFAGYRTTIENYLLEPDIFYDFTKSTEQSAYKNLFTSATEVKENLFDRAATKIAYFQAARHALGEIRNPDAKQLTNYMKDSGRLPKSLTVSECRRACYSLLRTYRKEAHKFSKRKFILSFDRFVHHFQQSTFISDSQYLIYYHGKDLQASMSEYLPNQFPFKSYYKFAINHFNYTKHPDLVELRDLINSL